MSNYNYAELMLKPITELTTEEHLWLTQKHNCTSCGWMQPNLQPPKQGSKFCRYPGAIESSYNHCLMWKVEPDPTKRYSGSWVADV